jgi:DNA-binding MarR family transcriptional regulator
MPKTEKELSKLITRAYDILNALYPSKELSAKAIAKTIKKSQSTVSRITELLNESELITINRTKDEKTIGKPNKNCTLTLKGRKIVELYQSKSKPEIKEEQINILISLLEDTSLSTLTRAVAAGTLTDNAVSNSKTLLRSSKIKDMFAHSVDNSLKVEEQIRIGTLSILSASLPFIIQDPTTADWFQKNLYKGLVNMTSDQTTSEPLQIRAIALLARTAQLSRYPYIIQRALETLLDSYFKNPKISNEIKGELLQLKPDTQPLIIKKLREEAKTENKKIEAEKLLRYLIQNWWNKDLSKFE